MVDSNVLTQLIQLSEDFLHCPICFEPFSQFSEPKSLPCLHTLCQKCLTGWVHTKSDNLNCPVCNDNFHLIPPSNGNLLKSFPTNFLIVDLKSRVEAMISAELKKDYVCALCRRTRGGEPSRFLCTDCSDTNFKSTLGTDGQNLESKNQHLSIHSGKRPLPETLPGDRPDDVLNPLPSSPACKKRKLEIMPSSSVDDKESFLNATTGDQGNLEMKSNAPMKQTCKNKSTDNINDNKPSSSKQATQKPAGKPTTSAAPPERRITRNFAQSKTSGKEDLAGNSKSTMIPTTSRQKSPAKRKSIDLSLMSKKGTCLKTTRTRSAIYSSESSDVENCSSKVPKKKIRATVTSYRYDSNVLSNEENVSSKLVPKQNACARERTVTKYHFDLTDYSDSSDEEKCSKREVPKQEACARTTIVKKYNFDSSDSSVSSDEENCASKVSKEACARTTAATKYNFDSSDSSDSSDEENVSSKVPKKEACARTTAVTKYNFDSSDSSDSSDEENVSSKIPKKEACARTTAATKYNFDSSDSSDSSDEENVSSKIQKKEACARTTAATKYNFDSSDSSDSSNEENVSLKGPKKEACARTTGATKYNFDSSDSSDSSDEESLKISITRPNRLGPSSSDSSSTDDNNCPNARSKVPVSTSSSSSSSTEDTNRIVSRSTRPRVYNFSDTSSSDDD